MVLAELVEVLGSISCRDRLVILGHNECNIYVVSVALDALNLQNDQNYQFFNVLTVKFVAFRRCKELFEKYQPNKRVFRVCKTIVNKMTLLLGIKTIREI